MIRIVRTCRWLGYLIWQILVGSWLVVTGAWRRKPFGCPAIVEYPMRCTTDTEVALFTSAITITPGTLVLGVVGAQDQRPSSVFVHSLFDNDRQSVINGLAELEWHLLHAMRRSGMKEAQG